MDHVETYVFPSTISVDSPLFKRVGLDRTNGIEKFEAENLPRDTALEARLSGEAALNAQPESGTGGEEIKVVPNTMMRLGVPLLLCFLLVFLWAVGVRVAKEWPRWKARRAALPAQEQNRAEVEALFNSLADLDELFAFRKIAEKDYWKERLELKARLVARLKKGPGSSLESYATRRTPR
jgi:hypothetical protein